MAKPKSSTKVVDHGDDAGGEQIVQRVDVGGDARDQAADRAAVEEAHRQALQVLENFLAQVVHRLLADRLHDANLHVLQGEAGKQGTQIRQHNPQYADHRRAYRDRVGGRGNDVVVHGDVPKRYGPTMSSGATPASGHGQHDHPAVRPQIAHQPPREVRVVGFPSFSSSRKSLIRVPTLLRATVSGTGRRNSRRVRAVRRACRARRCVHRARRRSDRHAGRWRRDAKSESWCAGASLRAEPRRMRSSVSVSTLESESSRIRICGLRRIARARAVRCFCPPESVMPRSPTMVS